jgi:hypothetical protein
MKGADMTEFNITERTEPFTIEEVFEFIDDTNISKIDAHELKSRIVDVIQAERNKAIDECLKVLKDNIEYIETDEEDYRTIDIDSILSIEQMKGGAE